MSHLPGKFVWFEHACPDPARARAFYEPLVGWHVESMPRGAESYALILNGKDGIGGLRRAVPGAASCWVSYLSVPDVDAGMRAAIAAGATGLMPPTDFGVGRAAGLADPTGALVALWKASEGDRPDVERPPVGDWFWNELWTTDAARALGFYERVFGYTHDAMDMGPQGTYYLLKGSDGVMRAGLMQATAPATGSMWLPYIHVADCDATVARAKQLGAPTVCVAPTDIPDVGRFAVLIDPTGATFAVIKGLDAPG